METIRALYQWLSWIAHRFSHWFHRQCGLEKLIHCDLLIFKPAINCDYRALVKIFFYWLVVSSYSNLWNTRWSHFYFDNYSWIVIKIIVILNEVIIFSHYLQSLHTYVVQNFSYIFLHLFYIYLVRSPIGWAPTRIMSNPGSKTLSLICTNWVNAA